MSEKNLKIVGWLGTLLSVIMYMDKLWTFKRTKGLSIISSKFTRSNFWIFSNSNSVLNNFILKNLDLAVKNSKKFLTFICERWIAFFYD